MNIHEIIRALEDGDWLNHLEDSEDEEWKDELCALRGDDNG